MLTLLLGGGVVLLLVYSATRVRVSPNSADTVGTALTLAETTPTDVGPAQHDCVEPVWVDPAPPDLTGLQGLDREQARADYTRYVEAKRVDYMRARSAYKACVEARERKAEADALAARLADEEARRAALAEERKEAAARWQLSHIAEDPVPSGAMAAAGLDRALAPPGDEPGAAATGEDAPTPRETGWRRTTYAEAERTARKRSAMSKRAMT